MTDLYFSKPIEISRSSVPRLQALGSTRVYAGLIAVVRNTLTIWKCTSASDSSSVWVPLVGNWDARAFGTTVTESVIQLAIDSCEAAGGGVVSLPEGTVTISTGIVLKAGVVLEGAGRESTILKGDSLSGAVIKGVYTDYSATLRNVGCKIRDLAVSNTSSAASGGIGIDLAQWTHARIEDVEVEHVSAGICL